MILRSLSRIYKKNISMRIDRREAIDAEFAWIGCCCKHHHHQQHHHQHDSHKGIQLLQTRSRRRSRNEDHGPMLHTVLSSTTPNSKLQTTNKTLLLPHIPSPSSSRSQVRWIALHCIALHCFTTPDLIATIHHPITSRRHGFIHHEEHDGGSEGSWDQTKD